jgi:hypothetical protein
MSNARRTDPETSHEAAASVKNKATTANTILWLLQSPMTDIELVNAYNAIAANGGTVRASESGIRTSRNKLWKEGKVVDTGQRSKTPSGRNAIVWQETDTSKGHLYVASWWMS